MPFNYDLTRRTKPILNLQGIHSMHFQYIQYSLQWSVSLLQKRSTLRVTAILRRGDRRGKHWVGQRWKRNTIVVLWQLWLWGEERTCADTGRLLCDISICLLIRSQVGESSLVCTSTGQDHRGWTVWGKPLLYETRRWVSEQWVTRHTHTHLREREGWTKRKTHIHTHLIFNEAHHKSILKWVGHR